MCSGVGGALIGVESVLKFLWCFRGFGVIYVSGKYIALCCSVGSILFGVVSVKFVFVQRLSGASFELCGVMFAA